VVDLLINKPASVRGYALHRLVAEYLQGRPALWADEGGQVRIRPRDATPPAYVAGTLLGFTVRACVSHSTKNRHHYLPVGDWRGRRTWLEAKAAPNGFEVVAVHVSGDMALIEAHDGRRFTVDATDFTGLLRVTDPQAFSRCLVTGVGKVGKAFGLGLLIVQ
jgi:hypothetical protein